MFTESADLYDLIYSFKDYRKESEEIISAIKERRPDCRSVLDIGCGTAEHHKYLKNEFQIDGLDLNEEFINLAKTKNPSGSYHLADMADFGLGRKYDAVICLFSSIGYVKTCAGLASALRCFNRHLNDGGLAMVEPWFTQEDWYEGKLHMLTRDENDIKICRMNMSGSDGKLSILNFHYLLALPGKGVRHFEERHELAMFSKDEMTQAFEEAGFDVSHDEKGLIGRGMYYAMKKADY